MGETADSPGRASGTDDDALSPTVASDSADALAHTITAATSTLRSDAPVPAVPSGAERYDRREEIGRGGMGVVYRAVDLQFSRDIALKQLRAELNDPAHVDRFGVECLVTANLEHPGVPAVYERGLSDGAPYYTMRRVRGRTLADALERATSLDDRLELIPGLLRVAQTLAYAHSRGVIHRDIKPNNIVLGDYGETFVLDWGIAKVQGVTADSTVRTSSPAAIRTHETSSGSVVGTPSYMAPEQAEGRVDATDERSDVFALGALLYHVLAGRAPYLGANVDQVIDRAKRADHEPIHTAAPRAPRALRLICDRAMAADPSDRFSSAGELAAALEHFTNNAVAHQDAGPVGWITRGVSVLTVLLAIAAAISVATFLPRFREFGWGAYPTVAFALTGLALSTLEFFTRGRYVLSPLILAMAAVTLLCGILATVLSMDTVLGALRREVAADEPRFRWLSVQGTHESIGNLTLGLGLTISQVLAWSVVRRRTLRS